MPSRLHVTSSSALGFVDRFFGAMGSNPAIQYVAPNGNDAASGADWTNAKKTILAAYDALPTDGGTVYIASESYVGGEVVKQGIWIIGPNDSQYNTPPAGWRRQKSSVRFIGVGYSGFVQGSSGNAIEIRSGQPGGGGDWPLDLNHPFIWLAGTNGALWFESLGTVYPKIGIRLGVSADQTSRNAATSGVMFRSVAVAVNNNGGGPVVDSGYAFWVWWEHCALAAAYNDSGGVPLALTDDAHAVMVLKPGPGGSAPGLWTVRNNQWAAGGLKVTRGSSSAGSLYVEDVVVESDESHPLPPVVWITNLDNNWTNVLIREVQQADATAGSMATVQIDGQATGSEAVVCIGSVGSIQGPCTVLGGSGAYELLSAVSPLRAGQVGIGGRRLIGPHDGARRRFGPTAVRFANLAVQDVTTWSGLTGSATVITGQSAPDGTNNAAKLTSASGNANKQVYRANQTYAVGDLVVWGGWLRATTPVVGSAPTIGLNLTGAAGFAWTSLDGGTTFHTNDTAPAVYPFLGDGEWAWVANAAKISAIGTNPILTVLVLSVYSGVPTVFYAPIFLHIAAGTISDNEAAELVTHLQSWSDAATVGYISPLKGQVINAIGGLATITKAGAPVDGDYATPVDGLIVTDTTNNKIWTRIGGVWKGIVVS